MEPFATLTELEARLEWDLDDGEKRIATGALESLSDDARFYGRNWLDAASAPAQVKNIVLKAAARFMRNPDSYTQSRAGDETLMWTDRGEASGEAELSATQIKMIRALAGNVSTLISAGTSPWGTVDPAASYKDSLVPVAGYTGEKPLPYFGPNYY